MKFVVLSDTHSKHYQLESVPDGDVLIHCGDYSLFGEFDETKRFLDWFSEQKHMHKIVIPGNHEVAICPRKNIFYNKELGNEIITDTCEERICTFNRINELIKSYQNIHFLVDDSITIDNIKFYGTPWCGGEKSVMGHWGFYLNEEEIRKQVFDRIPYDTDVLISHSPPYGILDEYRKTHLGCRALMKRVQQVKPVIHIFGHIHDAYGEIQSDYTSFYNCSNMNKDNNLSNPIKVIDL